MLPVFRGKHQYIQKATDLTYRSLTTKAGKNFIRQCCLTPQKLRDIFRLQMLREIAFGNIPQLFCNNVTSRLPDSTCFNTLMRNILFLSIIKLKETI